MGGKINLIMHKLKAGIIIFTVILSSCGGAKTAIIWTDRGEFALYGEYFNTVQDQYKVSVRYIESPKAELAKRKKPDLVIASWLKNSSTSSTFKSLNNLFGAKKLSRNIFYPRILAVGRIDRNQYLLPVSFNIPALIFSRDREMNLSNQFTVNYDEVKELSRPFNAQTRGIITRMGFSPLWNDEFIYMSAVLSGASFKEANPLTWDAASLEKSMSFINKWTDEINSSIQIGEDFHYKYFFEPTDRLIQSGRILFSYMESDDLFLLKDDRKNHLDFRWIMEQNKTPVMDDIVYMGIPKRGRSRAATRAFIQWFFTIETQRSLLEFSKSNRINENIFGISGGFSALSVVTEQIYPLFYPELLGRMPPSEHFYLPNILPVNWPVMKERVVLPYLYERARRENAAEIYPLERRLSDWMRQNR